MDYQLDSFINFCDDMQIAEESFKDSKPYQIFMKVKKWFIEAWGVIKRRFIVIMNSFKTGDYYIHKKSYDCFMKNLDRTIKTINEDIGKFKSTISSNQSDFEKRSETIRYANSRYHVDTEKNIFSFDNTIERTFLEMSIQTLDDLKHNTTEEKYSLHKRLMYMEGEREQRDYLLQRQYILLSKSEINSVTNKINGIETISNSFSKEIETLINSKFNDELKTYINKEYSMFCNAIVECSKKSLTTFNALLINPKTFKYDFKEEK